jgi:hypothetical protein
VIGRLVLLAICNPGLLQFAVIGFRAPALNGFRFRTGLVFLLVAAECLPFNLAVKATNGATYFGALLLISVRKNDASSIDRMCTKANRRR